MKRIILFTTFVLISAVCFSQDLISLKKGRRIEAIVIEVTPTLVRYKLFSNPEGKTYFVYKDDVAGIMYKDGKVEKFDSPGEQTTDRNSRGNQNQQSNASAVNQVKVETPDQSTDYSYQSRDFIRLKDGTSKIVRVLEITPTLVKYRAYDNPTGPIYSISKSDIYNIQYANGTIVKFDGPENPILGSQYQGEYATHFSQFHAGLAFPSGKFSDGNSTSDWGEDGRGYAAMGFTIGYKYYSSVSVKNLYWVFGIEAFYNELNSDLKDDYDNYILNSDITFSKYFNFPATLGLNYSIPLAETFRIYGEASIGVNFSLLTNFAESSGSNNNYPNYDHDYTNKFTPAFGFAYGLEGGVFINQKYSISVRYNNLGSYKYKYTYDDGGTHRFAKAIPITCTSLCFGILF